MNTVKMIAELKMTCANLEADKKELMARVKELDDNLTGYRMAIDALELTLKAKEDASPENDAPKIAELPMTARKDTKMLTYNGKTQTIRQWAEELHMTVSGINYRIRTGWSIEDALTRNPNPGSVVLRKKPAKSAAKKVFKYDRMNNPLRQYMSLADAARDLHMSESTVQKIVEHVPKSEQLKSHDYYLDYAK